MLKPIAQTRTAATEEAYLVRDARMRRAAATHYAVAAPTDDQYVSWLANVKRPQVKPNAWYQYRASAREALLKSAASHPERKHLIDGLIQRLDAGSRRDMCWNWLTRLRATRGYPIMRRGQ